MSVKTKITDLQPDYVIGGGADTNSPAGADSMAGILDDFFRSDYSIMRSESLNKGWERWLGVTTPNAPSPNAPTYVSGTQYTVPGDWTSAGTYYPAITTVGRRIEASVTAGAIYGYISASSYAGGVTTVTCVWDSGALDAGLTEVQYGIAANNVPSMVLRQDNAPDYCVITNGGSGAAFTGALAPAIVGYVVGKTYRFMWTQASQGGDTIALNGLAALTFKKSLAGSLVSLSANDVAAGQITDAAYDGTNLQIIGSVGVGALSNAVLATPGSGNWTIPAGVTSVIAELYGAGGGAWTSGTSLGGDGAYLKMALSGLTPGGTIAYTVGAGGAAGAPGAAGGAVVFAGISCNGGGAATSTGVNGTNGAVQQTPGTGVIEQIASVASTVAGNRALVRGGANNAAGENGMIIIRW